MYIYELYDFIVGIEMRIGYGAKARIGIEGKGIKIRIDWWDDDFHAVKLIPCENMKDERILEDFIIYCQKEYRNFKEQKASRK